MRKIITRVLVIALFFFFIIPLFLKFESKYSSGEKVEGFEIRGEFIDIKGYKTYVERYNEDGDRVITFIHGFGGSTHNWRNNIEYFVQEGFEVLVVDLKGFGLSQKGIDFDYSHSAQSELIRDLFEYYGIEKSVLVGHSMGGNVVTTFAMKFPEKVESLVLVDAAIVESSTLVNNLSRVLSLYPLRSWASLFLTNYFSKERFTEFLLSAYEKRDSVNEEDISRFFLPLEIEGWQDSLLGIIRDSSRNKVPNDISSIDLPTLIIWGSEDPWISVEEGRRLNEEIKGAQFIEIEGAGHLPMEESPEEFNEVLNNFLD